MTYNCTVNIFCIAGTYISLVKSIRPTRGGDIIMQKILYSNCFYSYKDMEKILSDFEEDIKWHLDYHHGNWKIKFPIQLCHLPKKDGTIENFFIQQLEKN